MQTKTTEIKVGTSNLLPSGRDAQGMPTADLSTDRPTSPSVGRENRTSQPKNLGASLGGQEGDRRNEIEREGSHPILRTSSPRRGGDARSGSSHKRRLEVFEPVPQRGALCHHETCNDQDPPPLRFNDAVCSSELRELILSEYPVLGWDEPLRRFFAFVVYGGVRCNETGWVPVSYYTLGAISGQWKQAASGNFSGENFLLEAKERAFHGLELAPYNKDLGLARRIKTLGLSRDLQRIILDELATPLSELRDPVFFVSGKSATDKRKRVARTLAAQVARDKSAALEKQDSNADLLPFPSESYQVLDYMSGVSRRLFTTAVNRGIEGALNIAHAIPESPKRACALATLRAVQAEPMPIYQLSSKRRTVRVWSASASLLTLPRGVRRSLTDAAGWIELDLKSSQLAIAARQWGVEGVCDMLSDGYDIWEDVATLCGLSSESEDWAQAKSLAFKRALYSAVFGMARPALQGQLTRNLGRTVLERSAASMARRFLDLPVVASMFKQRERQLALIEDQGGATDCFGRFIRVCPGPDEVSPRSVLAQLAQAQELAIVFPVIDIARSERDLHVVLWQHDGFSLAVSDAEKKDYYLRRVRTAIEAEAERCGVPTQLIGS